MWIAQILHKAELDKQIPLPCSGVWGATAGAAGGDVCVHFANANRSLRDHPPVLPVGYAELMELTHLASSCFSSLWIFFRSPSCLCWDQQCSACITPHVWWPGVWGAGIGLWAAQGPRGAASLSARNGSQSHDSPALCRDHLDSENWERRSISLRVCMRVLFFHSPAVSWGVWGSHLGQADGNLQLPKIRALLSGHFRAQQTLMVKADN